MSSVVMIRSFGEALASRTEGREAGLAATAYNFSGQPPTKVILDFTDVAIMTPSWLSEFIQTLMAAGVKEIEYTNTSVTVDSSIEVISDEITPQPRS